VNSLPRLNPIGLKDKLRWTDLINKMKILTHSNSIFFY